MASSPDLFVVCKNCGQEVSPYITECPYCGTRLRKRAPKIERDGTVSEPKPKKQRRAKPARIQRPRREPADVGAAVGTRPWATLALVLLSLFDAPAWGSGWDAGGWGGDQGGGDFGGGDFGGDF